MPISRRRAAAQGRRHRVGRRGRRRHRDGAGVRPRGRRARALHGARRRACATAREAAHVEARYLPGDVFLPSLAHRARAAGGRPPGHRRRPHDRRVRALPHPAAAARLAARGARLDHQPRPARDRLGRPQLRLARGHPAAARAGASRAALPAGPLGIALRGRALRATPAGARGAARRRPRRRARRDRGGLRRHRERQDDAAQPAAALLRPARPARVRAGRRRPARPARSPTCARDVAIVTQRAVLFSHHAAREPHARRGPTRRGRRCSAACQAAGVAAFAPTCRDGYDTLDRRARRQPLGRPAPARRPGPRARRRRPRDRARRPALGRRHRDRAPARREPAPGPGGAHGAARRAAPVDRRGGRPRGRARRRRDRRGGHRGRSCSTAGGMFTDALRRRGRCSASMPRPHAVSRACATTSGRAAGCASACSRRRRAQAAAHVAGWLLVGDAIDHGIRAGDRDRLYLDVAIFVAVSAGCWVLGTYLSRGARGARPGDRAGAAAAPLRPPHRRSRCATSREQRAGWIIARLTSDVDALTDVLSARASRRS